MMEDSERTVSGIGLVRAYIARRLDVFLQKTCQKKEYDALIQMYRLDPEAEDRLLTELSSDWSFYEEEYTWEDLFSKKARMQLSEVLDNWLRRALNNLDKARETAEQGIKKRLCQAAADYKKDEKHGPGFVYSFLKDWYLPEIKKKKEELESRAKKARDAKRELSRELEDYYCLAAKARRFGGEREERLDEYVDAMENYRIHIFRMQQNEAMAELLDGLLKTGVQIEESIGDLLHDMQIYVVNYRDFEKEKAADAWEFSELWKTILEKLRKGQFAEEISKLEDRILECQRIPLEEWECREEEKPGEWEADVSVPRKEYWEWVRELVFYRILDMKDQTVCEVYITEENPVLPEYPSPMETLMFLQQTAGEEARIKTISFSVSGGIGNIGEYLSKNKELCRICETELAKKKAKETQYLKMIRMPF